MKAREVNVLREAIEVNDGWGLVFRSTVAILAERGYFERAEHPLRGEQWRVTEAGRRAFAESTP